MPNVQLFNTVRSPVRSVATAPVRCATCRGCRPTMKLSDYVVQFVAQTGASHVFMLPGGGAMHLNDSLGRCRELQYVCNLHEQASAIAAEAYARVTGNLAACCATPVPRGTKPITALPPAP